MTFCRVLDSGGLLDLEDRILDLEDRELYVEEGILKTTNLTDAAPSLVKVTDMFGPSRPRTSLKRKRGEDQDEADEVSLFRRVRIYNTFRDLVLPAPPRSDLNYRVRVYELRINNWFDLGTGYVDIRPEFQVRHLHCFVNKNIHHRTLRQLLIYVHNRIHDRDCS